MKYLRINTDREARSDVKTCDLWYEHNFAFAGDKLDEASHYSAFEKCSPNDIIFMHQSKEGIIGMGIVKEKWDGITYKNADRLLYQKEPFEYRLKVQWSPCFDRRENPIPIKDIFKNYRMYYSEINRKNIDIGDVIIKLIDWDFETEEKMI